MAEKRISGLGTLLVLSSCGDSALIPGIDNPNYSPRRVILNDGEGVDNEIT